MDPVPWSPSTPSASSHSTSSSSPSRRRRRSTGAMGQVPARPRAHQPGSSAATASNDDPRPLSPARSPPVPSTSRSTLTIDDSNHRLTPPSTAVPLARRRSSTHVRRRHSRSSYPGCSIEHNTQHASADATDSTSRALLALLRGESDVPDPDSLLREAVPAWGGESDGVNGHLRCSICLGLFVRPYTTANGCGHTYCQVCLLHTFRAVADQIQAQIRSDDQAFVDQQQHFLRTDPDDFGADDVPSIPLLPAGWSSGLLEAAGADADGVSLQRLRALLSLSVPCPTCRAPLTLSDLVPAPRIVQHMIDSLPVLCPYKDLGCNATPERSELRAHVESCAYAPQPEPLELLGPRPSGRRHSGTTCPHCGEALEGMSLTRHRRRVCQTTEVGCPLCSHTVPRHALSDHLLEDCLSCPVQCPRGKFGCLWEGKRALCPDGHSLLTPAQVDEHVHASRPPKLDADGQLRRRSVATDLGSPVQELAPDRALSTSLGASLGPTDHLAPLEPTRSPFIPPELEPSVHVCPLAPLEGWLQARQNEMDAMKAENATLRSSLAQVQDTLAKLVANSDRCTSALGPFLPPPSTQELSSVGHASRPSLAPASRTLSLASLVDDLLASPALSARTNSEGTDDSAYSSHRHEASGLGHSPTPSRAASQPPSSSFGHAHVSPVPLRAMPERASLAAFSPENPPLPHEALSSSAPAAVDDVTASIQSNFPDFPNASDPWPPVPPSLAQSGPASNAGATETPRNLAQEVSLIRSSIQDLTQRLTLGETRSDQALRLAQSTNADTARLMEETSGLGRVLHMQMHQLMIQTQRSSYSPMYMPRPPGGPPGGPAGVDPGHTSAGISVPGPVGPMGPALAGMPGGGPLPAGAPGQFRRWNVLEGTKL